MTCTSILSLHKRPVIVPDRSVHSENANYVTAAGSILTVEARHNAFVRLLNNYDIATPFDTPLSASAVVGAAGALFKQCPEGSAPTIQPPPALTLNTTSYEIGSQITVAPANASAINTDQQLYCGFASLASLPRRDDDRHADESFW